MVHTESVLLWQRWRVAFIHSLHPFRPKKMNARYQICYTDVSQSVYQLFPTSQFMARNKLAKKKQKKNTKDCLLYMKTPCWVITKSVELAFHRIPLCPPASTSLSWPVEANWRVCLSFYDFIHKDRARQLFLFSGLLDRSLALWGWPGQLRLPSRLAMHCFQLHCDRSQTDKTCRLF